MGAQANKSLKYLFVGGPPRSGTTALAKLLNHHPKIAIGIERYKYLYHNAARNCEIGPGLFESQRFFDIRQEETNVKGHAYENFRELQRKFHSAYYRGDKLPGVARMHATLDRTLHRTRYIFIYRDVERVCSSWNARAENPRDAWPEKNDYRMAVRWMNADFRRIHALATGKPKKFILVNYDELFGENGGVLLAALLRQLGLTPHPHIARYLQKNIETYRSLSLKPLHLNDGHRKFIQANVDWAMVGKIKEISLKPAETSTA